MATKTTETFEAATERLAKNKTARTEANEAMEAFRKANSIKKGTKSDEIKDKDIKKQYQALMKTQKEAREQVEDAENAVKALKPKSTRTTTYEYPADCVTAEDKKRFRTKARAAAAKAAKPAKEEKPKKEKSEEGKAKKAEPAAEGKKADKGTEKKKVKKSED